MRRGFFVTALVAAVLLAASSGTAYAQSVGFDRTSGTLVEKASGDSMTPAPVDVIINVSGLTLAVPATEGTPAIDGNAETGLGTLTIVHDADAADTLMGGSRRIWLDSESSAVDNAPARLSSLTAHPDHDTLYGLDTGDTIPYDNNGVIRLVLIDPDGDGDWMDNEFSMKLMTAGAGTVTFPPTPSPADFKGTVRDTDEKPAAVFSKATVTLPERVTTTDSVSLNVVAGKADDAEDDPEDLGDLTTDNITFRVSPAGAVAAACPPPADPDDSIVLALGLTGIASEDDMSDAYDTYVTNVGVDGLVAGATGTGSSFTITACGDMSGYADNDVTFTIVDTETDSGDITAGPMLVVTVDSDEPVPTVGFTTTRIEVDEGATESVYIAATNTEVGTVEVEVGGDAMISLWQDDSMIEANDDGSYTVLLGTSDMPSARTVLTVSADDDDTLHEGATATATVTITDANEATISDATLSVTVHGVGVAPDPDPEIEPAIPTVSFTTTSLDLDEGGQGSVSFDVVDEDEVGVDAVMVSVSDGAAIALHQDGSALEAGADGNYAVDPSGDLMVSADADEDLMDAEFRQATLEIVDSGDDAYVVGDNGSVAVTVSGDSDIPAAPLPVPTVSFTKDSLSLAEGESDSLFLIADVAEGAEVGTATLTVAGDALISFSQDGSALAANADGTYSVDFGGSENASLTVTADDDAELYAGEQKTATVSITGGENAAPAASNTTLAVTVDGEGEPPVDPPAPTPTASFESTAVSIDEGDEGSVSIDAGEGVETVMVSMSGSAMIALYQGGSALEAGADGNFAVDPSADVTISSEPDEDLMDGEQKLATLTLVDAEAYDVSGNRSVTVTVVGSSDVPGPLPTVSFLDSMLTLKEGAYGTLRLQRMGEFRDAPGTVMVSVAGDAVIELSQSGNALADDGAGNYSVSLSSGALTDLTVTSLSDRDLEDGSEASATLTISEGYGAVAGDNATLTVTVIGSTAVPALPLVGQLLLALFLMVGGARLYRRRNG